MRLNTTLFTLGVLLGTALADIATIRTSMENVSKMANELSKAIVKWPGTASSGGDMLCKTVALRKSLYACAKAFQTSQPLKNSDVSRNGLPLVRLANAMFELKDRAVEARPNFDRIGATASMFEMIKAQQAPASDMSKAMKAVLDKLPPGFKNTKVPVTNQNAVDFAQTFMNKEIDDLLRKLQPRPEQQSPLTPFVLMAARVSESIDTDPFCRSIPQLMKTLAGQSTNLGDFTNQALKVLDSSGVQDVVPLNVFKRSAEAFGVPPNVIPNVLKTIGVPEKGLPLREFTKPVPRLLSTNFGTVTKQALKVLESSGVQDVDPLDFIKKRAEAFGVSRDTTGKVLKTIGVPEKRLPLRNFTRQVPRLLSTNLSTLTTQALKVLESSGVQDVALLDFIKGAEAFGVSRDTTGKVLKEIGISEKRLSLREFTNQVPRLLNNLKFKNKALGDMVLGDIVLGDMVLDTPTMIRFADSVVEKVLGSTPR